ncbi:histone acetyltransferase type B catalytic subunit [Rutidosis leptorrhynchoides]|uniref:histone acetyltransferase type B catalytic subunit n=1 Tax=Rutidosis leptorrhynchoides TaxID=125765 RepID=UPI003A998779
MGTKNQSSDTTVSDHKKRRKVGFNKIDEGVLPNDYIKIYFVSREDEVGSPESFPIEPVDLSSFFEEDGKIYGYQGLKITVWISSISFQAYADISFESASDAGKGITDLKSSLEKIFADNLVETKDDFLKTFSTESDYVKSMISSGKVIQQNVPPQGNENLKADCSELEVVRVEGESMGLLYCRLVPLVLLLVDGSNPIDVTDPDWEMYLLVEKKSDQQDSPVKLLGFAALYRFFHYPDTHRLRLGQILVFPSYQRKGYGGHLLQVLTNMVVSDNVYDLSIEEPLDSLQHVRACIDIPRLLALESIQPSLNSVVARLKEENLAKRTTITRFGPPSDTIEEVRKTLKINKKQFVQCWEILIYIALDPIDKFLENFKTIVLDRIRADVIGKDTGASGKRVIDIPTEYDPEASFVMFKTSGGDGEESKEVEMEEDDKIKQEEQLQKLVDARIEAIKVVAQKVSVKSS